MDAYRAEAAARWGPCPSLVRPAAAAAVPRAWRWQGRACVGCRSCSALLGGAQRAPDQARRWREPRCLPRCLIGSSPCDGARSTARGAPLPSARCRARQTAGSTPSHAWRPTIAIENPELKSQAGVHAIGRNLANFGATFNILANINRVMLESVGYWPAYW